MGDIESFLKDYILIFIWITLTIGLLIIRNILLDIKKRRERSDETQDYLKQIIIYLGRQGGFFNGNKE